MLPVPAFPSAEELLAEGVRTEYPGRPLLGALLVASVRPRSVLDIGGKEGWLFRFLEERARPERMISLDRDARAVARAYPGAARVVADALHLPVHDESFEAVAMFDVIEHVPQRREADALREAARVLEPGGLLFLSTPNAWAAGTILDPAFWIRGHRHYRRETIVSLIEGAGLRLVARTIRGRWRNIAGLGLMYVASGLHLPMPAARAFRRWSLEEYSRPGRYTHFVVARKPPA